VRVHFASTTTRHPHPNPLPEYRERGQEWRCHYTREMRAATFVAAPLLLACLSAAPAPPPKEPSSARKFLELTKTDALGRQTIETIVRQVRPDLPNVPAAFWQEFINNTDPRGLFDDLAPVYEKHFTPGELTELIKFYESPVGQKLVQIQPQLNRDALRAGQVYGTKVTQELMRQLKEKKYLR
jgi:hypothetical protein